MKSGRWGGWVCAALLAGSAGLAQAAAIVDQEFDPRTGDRSLSLLAVMYRGGFFAQTFTAGVSGRLVRVDVMLSRQASMTQNLLFELTTTVDGYPSPTLGAPSMGVIPYEQIPVDPVGTAGGSRDWVSLDLSSFDISVNAGDEFAIVLKLDTGGFVPPDGTRTFDMLWHGLILDPYWAGSVFTHASGPGSPPWNPVIVQNETADQGFRTWVEPVLDVTIAVKPGSEGEPINALSHGTLPIAILSDVGFDAAQLDPRSILANGAPVQSRMNGTPIAALEDVNGDGRADMVLHFATADLELTGEEAAIVVTGMTRGGLSVRGTESVLIVP